MPTDCYLHQLGPFAYKTLGAVLNGERRPAGRKPGRVLVIGCSPIDIEHCPHCGGNLKIIAAIEDPAVIAKILAHFGLPTRAPPRSPARSFGLIEAVA